VSRKLQCCGLLLKVVGKGVVHELQPGEGCESIVAPLRSHSRAHRGSGIAAAQSTRAHVLRGAKGYSTCVQEPRRSIDYHWPWDAGRLVWFGGFPCGGDSQARVAENTPFNLSPWSNHGYCGRDYQYTKPRNSARFSPLDAMLVPRHPPADASPRWRKRGI
jgi:hypothetical protein